MKTVIQVRQEKKALEKRIIEMLQHFEKENEIRIDEIKYMPLKFESGRYTAAEVKLVITI